MLYYFFTCYFFNFPSTTHFNVSCIFSRFLIGHFYTRFFCLQLYFYHCCFFSVFLLHIIFPIFMRIKYHVNLSSNTIYVGDTATNIMWINRFNVYSMMFVLPKTRLASHGQQLVIRYSQTRQQSLSLSHTRTHTLSSYIDIHILSHKLSLNCITFSKIIGRENEYFLFITF